MSNVFIKSNYYRQFGADYSLDFPGEGFHGWGKEELEIDPEHTAVVVMHAWDCGTLEMYPGWYSATDFIPRTKKIMKEVFPELLSAVRNSGMKLYHVTSSDSYCKDYPGYKIANDLAQYGPRLEQAQSDPILQKLRSFKRDYAHPGKQNLEDISRGFSNMKFPKEAEPIGDEPIAKDSEQLFALCKRDGINHLIYAGFAINMCLLLSPGGMLDMSRRGLMCSAIRQAVTAVECRETARLEQNKEEGLWRVAVLYGFVYDVDDFVYAIKDLKLSGVV